MQREMSLKPRTAGIYSYLRRQRGLPVTFASG